MPSNHHLEWLHEMQFIMLMLSFVQKCLPLWLQDSPPTMMVILSSILDLEIKHVSCKHHMSTSLYKQKYSEKQDATGRVWSWPLSSNTVFARWWRIKSSSNNKEAVYQLTKWLAQKWSTAPITPFLILIPLFSDFQDQDQEIKPCHSETPVVFSYPHNFRIMYHLLWKISTFFCTTTMIGWCALQFKVLTFCAHICHKFSAELHQVTQYK
jgi:hypothetical protein